MLELKKVAVTGGLSSGKTAVCHLFGQLNAYVVNTDAIVHELLAQHSPIRQQVVALLGKDIVKNGALERAWIAEKVFNNPELLKQLEECLYPAIIERTERHYQEAKHVNSPLFIVEVPKLFESDMESWFDVIVTVDTEESVAIERFENRGGTKDEYQKRMAHQMPVKEKVARSHYIIENNGDLKSLKSAVTQLFHVLRGVAP